MFFKLFSQTADVDGFAKSLAEDFARKFPSALQGQKTKDSAHRLSSAVGELNQKARQFNLENRIGLYRKAKLSNIFKWALREQGYQDELIDEIIKGMLIAMARKPGR